MKIKALVVDRRSMERNELTKPLKRIGVRKVTEVNVEEFRARPLKAGAFDLVFIEFNTLMEAGRGLLQMLRRADCDVPVIVTYPESVDVADVRKFCPEASSTLRIPFTNQQLRQIVERHVLEKAY
jgi:DNA-binding NtrC family response regulator